MKKNHLIALFCSNVSVKNYYNWSKLKQAKGMSFCHFRYNQHSTLTFAMQENKQKQSNT